jgi:hypothetical protein
MQACQAARLAALVVRGDIVVVLLALAVLAILLGRPFRRLPLTLTLLLPLTLCCLKPKLSGSMYIRQEQVAT